MYVDVSRNAENWVHKSRNKLFFTSIAQWFFHVFSVSKMPSASCQMRGWSFFLPHGQEWLDLDRWSNECLLEVRTTWPVDRKNSAAKRPGIGGVKCKASVLCYYLSISLYLYLYLHIYIYTYLVSNSLNFGFPMFFSCFEPQEKRPFSENSSQLLIFLTFFPQETYSWAQCRTSQQSWVVVEHQETASVYLDETKFTQLRMIKFPTSEVESLSQGFIHLCKTSGFLQWSKQTCRSRTYLCHFGVLGNIYL